MRHKRHFGISINKHYKIKIELLVDTSMKKKRADYTMRIGSGLSILVEILAPPQVKPFLQRTTFVIRSTKNMSNPCKKRIPKNVQ